MAREDPRWRFNIVGRDRMSQLARGEIYARDPERVIRALRRLAVNALDFRGCTVAIEPANEAARAATVLHAYDREGTIAGAAKRAGVSRPTARKYLRAHGKVD